MLQMKFIGNQKNVDVSWGRLAQYILQLMNKAPKKLGVSSITVMGNALEDVVTRHLKCSLADLHQDVPRPATFNDISAVSQQLTHRPHLILSLHNPTIDVRP